MLPHEWVGLKRHTLIGRLLCGLGVHRQLSYRQSGESALCWEIWIYKFYLRVQGSILLRFDCIRTAQRMSAILSYLYLRRLHCDLELLSAA
jgi:hypothetical protein